MLTPLQKKERKTNYIVRKWTVWGSGACFFTHVLFMNILGVYALRGECTLLQSLKRDSQSTGVFGVWASSVCVNVHVRVHMSLCVLTLL